jgi:hypothetical protein
MYGFAGGRVGRRRRGLSVDRRVVISLRIGTSRSRDTGIRQIAKMTDN